MSLRTWSFHHKDTGLFNGANYSSDHNTDGRTASVAENTPADHVAVEGVFDYLSQRVDLASGQVVDYQPPAPSVDHEWNASTKRWHLSAAVSARNQARDVALAAIARLEASQPRAMRDFVLRGDNSRILAIDAAIERLRADL